MTGPRPRATVREVPRSGTWDGGPSGPAASRPASSARPRDRGAPTGWSEAPHVAWHTDPTLRIVGAIALVIVGTGLVFGLSAIDFAILTVAVIVVIVATLVRASLVAGASLDGPSSRAFAAAAGGASGAVGAAMVGAAVVIVMVFGARLVGAFR